eukprot:1192045-Prorocentrum_minimum.AAC.1
MGVDAPERLGGRTIQPFWTESADDGGNVVLEDHRSGRQGFEGGSEGVQRGFGGPLERGRGLHLPRAPRGPACGGGAAGITGCGGD